MRRNIPEVWMLILVIIAAVVMPLLVGFTVLKIWRKFHPLEEVAPGSTHAVIENAQRDGFFKMLFLGWLICGPILYYFYSQSF